LICSNLRASAASASCLIARSSRRRALISADPWQNEPKVPPWPTGPEIIRRYPCATVAPGEDSSVISPPCHWPVHLAQAGAAHVHRSQQQCTLSPSSTAGPGVTKMPLQPSSSSFVIRIWREEAHPGQPDAPWRAHVQHTRSGEVVNVQDLSGLVAFLERWMGKLSSEGQPSTQPSQRADGSRSIK
jgi:hypothetical protein